MANQKLFDRVKVTVSGTPGTGTITLGSAATGYRTFAGAGVANGNVVTYLIEDGTGWEFGTGTYTSSGTTLSRDTVSASSAGGTTKITVTSAAFVYITALSADLIQADSAGNVGIGTTTPAVKVDINSTDAIHVPVGTTAQRPTGANGYVRYNTDLTSFEGYGNGAWGSIGGGAVGGGTDHAFYENDVTITTSYTITTNKNAGSFGPVTINSGATVTVPSGSTWTIV